MTDLKVLRYKRGQLKAQVTRFRGYLESLDMANIFDTVVIQLKLRLEKIESIYNSFADVQDDIENLLHNNPDLESDIETESASREDFETSYYEAVSLARSLINKHELQNNADDGISNVSARFNRECDISQVKLPIINLPVFKGAFDKWLQFKDSFEALVNSNSQLSSIQKFYYLISCLEGEPSDLIKSVDISTENYATAWTILSERYENKKLLINKYVHAMFNMPNLVKESYTDLRNLNDTYKKSIRSLNSLGIKTDTWDILLIYLLVNKLDNKTRRDWEAYDTKKEIPSISDLETFLKNKCNILENLELSKTNVGVGISKFETKHRFSRANERMTSTCALSQQYEYSCYYCKKNHSIFKCNTFLKLDVIKRIKEIKQMKLCENCFSSKHSTHECKKAGCRTCQRRHNSLLHRDENQKVIKSNASTECNAENSKTESSITIAAHSTNHFTCALLTTAIIEVKDKLGNVHRARALVDPGSQSNFVTEEFAKKLDLIKIPFVSLVVGIGENASLPIKYRTKMTIKSHVSEYSNNISCYVLPKITQEIPTFSFNHNYAKIPSEIQLADPNFNVKNKIDILLGVEVFFDILMMEQVHYDKYPTLQNTKLGWLIGGKLYCPMRGKAVTCLSINESINQNLIKFWNIEECVTKDQELRSNDFCENYFKETVRRDINGRFIVRIPFKDNLGEIGNSKEVALQRLDYLEKRFQKNIEFKNEYVKFMLEYATLGHMKQLKEFDIHQDDDVRTYYLPHHAVIKEDSSTTKLRVVFDASAKPNNGRSLNDVQYAGPSIQTELFSILLRFRKHRYILNADISKMYRQILINPEETRFQRIFWRQNIDSELKCYELQTITYGTASAPYLALRCLKQLAYDNKSEYPVASEIILKDFYMDDLLSGADSEENLIKLQTDITNILASAGFELRKWLSNKKDFCNKFTVNNELEASIVQLGENEQNKTLGIFWNANADSLQYHIRDFGEQRKFTKRNILSIISQIFDPLGLIAPVIFGAKLILQLLWRERLEWDQNISETLKEKWVSFCNDLKNLNNLQIARQVCVSNSKWLELHMFADASEKGYGVCAYIRYKIDSKYESNLLCAKSKIAPVKQITVPRLELCAATLAAELYNKIINNLSVKFDKIYMWSDSTITLHWINGNPDRWKTFVANRVGTIQTLTEVTDWYHIKSQDNPADILSRGSTVKDLVANNLWWKGPSWFNSSTLPIARITELISKDIPEQRISVNVVTNECNLDIFNKYSDLTKLIRVIAYCLRFVHNVTNKNKLAGPLSVNELTQSLNVLLKTAQRQSFVQEYLVLKSKGNIKKSSNIASLNPYFERELIRVGGRIQRANLPYNVKHPIILHNKHPLTVLILRHEHERMMHCGPQQLLYTIRQNYWPISGLSIAKKVVHTCVICFKAKPRAFEYKMGNLPAERVNKYLPFVNVGCDYAGPFLIKERRFRNIKFIKVYVCLFICMSTKAVHLEAVTDLTTEGFLATFRRFIARRGRPSNVFSDNATNFVGASVEISKFLLSECDTIKKGLANDLINWQFIPPRAPNQGGLWEAGIKSCKYHMKRVMGNASLTYEDFMTILIQIEAILNSRPLCPLSLSPDDLNPLTPGHFLIGRNLMSLPEPDLTQIAENRLNQYKRLQQLLQSFWQRWQKEYISELQCRQRWKQQSSRLIQLDDLVLLKEDNVPPLKWKLARVCEVFPGEDKIIRVVKVKCSDGSILKRSILKLCPLPIETK